MPRFFHCDRHLSPLQRIPKKHAGVPTAPTVAPHVLPSQHMRILPNGAPLPSNHHERRIYDRLMEWGWRPPSTGQAIKCPRCGIMFFGKWGWRSAWAETSGNVAQPTYCSPECTQPDYLLSVKRRHLLLTILYMAHRRRVVEYLGDFGWSMVGSVSAKRRVRGNTYNRWSSGYATFQHPNDAKRLLRVCMTPRWQPSWNCDIHFPPMALDSPLIVDLYCAYVRAGRTGTYRKGSSTGCGCPTCFNLERLVPYEQARLVERAFSDMPLRERIYRWTRGGVRLSSEWSDEAYIRQYTKELAQSGWWRERNTARTEGRPPRPNRLVSGLQGVGQHDYRKRHQGVEGRFAARYDRDQSGHVVTGVRPSRRDVAGGCAAQGEAGYVVQASQPDGIEQAQGRHDDDSADQG